MIRHKPLKPITKSVTVTKPVTVTKGVTHDIGMLARAHAALEEGERKAMANATRCPACGRPFALSAAERQRMSRERRKGARQ